MLAMYTPSSDPNSSASKDCDVTIAPSEPTDIPTDTAIAVAVFEPSSIFSLSHATELLNWVKQSLEAGANCLFIDLHHVRFMDMGALGVLVTALKQVHQAAAEMVLCHLNAQPRMVLEMTQMLTTFTIADQEPISEA